MLSKALNYLSAVFAAIWIVVIFAEYWAYNPNYSKSIQLFEYLDLLIIFILIGAGLTWYHFKKGKKQLTFLNGMTVFLGLLVVDVIAVSRFCSKVRGVDLSASGMFTHLGHIIGVSICLFLIYLVIRVIGSIFNTILPIGIPNEDSSVIHSAIGILILVTLMFFLGLIDLLNGFVLIPICLLILAFYWRKTYEITKQILFKPVNISSKLNVVGIFSFLFLGVFLIMNFVQILRPFPIGADSLRVYVNLPSLIAEYGGLVDGNRPYNWSLFMSLGLIIFGRIDVVLGLSFLGGLLSLQALYRLSRKWLNPNYSALVLLLFYSLPMISFLSYMDMKIDMGLMYLTLCVLLLFYNWFKPVVKDKSKEIIKGPGLLKTRTFFKNRIPSLFKQNRLLVLMGLLAGFACGIKLTALFFFLALLASIWFMKGNKLTFVTSFILCFAAVFLLKLDAQPALRQFHDGVNIIEWGLLITGLALIGFLFLKQKQKLKELMTYSLIVGSFFMLPIIPWVGKNLSETGKMNVTSLLNGKKASPQFKLDKAKIRANKDKIIIPGLYQMPTVDKPQNNAKKNNAKKNNKKRSKKAVSVDLHRFMGYEILPARYLSLPYDVFINTNISGFFTDVGFILLLLFPILYLFQKRKELEWSDVAAKLSFMALSLLMLLIAIPSAFMNKNGLNNTGKALKLLEARSPSGILSEISNYTNKTLLEIYSPVNQWLTSITSSADNVTYPLLLLLFIGILLLALKRIKDHSKVTQSIVLFLSMYFFLWWILGSGAPWYGILLFSIPMIFLMKTIAPQKIEKGSSNWPRQLKTYVFLSVGVLWVLLAFSHRVTNYEPTDETRAKRLYYPAILNYQMGNYNKNKVMDYHFPNVRQLVAPINKDKKALVYMVGSPYRYFIDKNDSRVLSDTYLDFFSDLIKRYETKENIIKTLKDRGFGYIIFDLNMVSYDVTPDKSLTGRFTQFMNSLYGNSGVELMATDRKIKLNSSGEEVFDVFQDKGTITTSGSVAIFKIK